MIKDRIPKEEIEKWMERLEKKLKDVKINKENENFVKNIHAYVKDCKYWIEKGDYVKAWEVISFAWGLYEAGVELNFI
ncbi:MAG: DUF357 domain-containing protein [Candidatus Aenigmatarchaeota archaeon]|nr:DUF357 domain-containing protein [Candidatus Aenigmarchaeota archaeon]